MKRTISVFCPLAVILTFAPLLSFAGGPTGGVVVGGAGNATIAGQGTSVTTINQSANQAIINWQQFSIGQGDLVKFIQPSATAIALNRVLSGSPTQIYGSLQANGRVIVINPNGIMVGAGGQVDTKGFVASTLNVSDAGFLAGGSLLFSGSSTAAVRNQGTIQALGGDVFLIAHTVDNSGTINAPQGVVGLAAGSAVQLVQSGNERISVLAGNSSTPAAVGVNNSGTVAAASAELKAAGGNIYALAINNGGVVRATGVVSENGHIYLRAAGGNIQNTGTLAAKNADGSGGTVILDGGHNATAPATVISSGTIDASGAAGTKGGTVEILGDNVGLFDNALVNVSGDAGGGTALIGGDLHGANPAIQDAQHTYVGQDASIKADATGQGNGGEVVIWSDEATRDYGSLSAHGGAAGGNGGFAEVSSKGQLDFAGMVDLGASAGQGGTLLLDPLNITISTAAAANTTGFNPGTDNTEAFADDGVLNSVFHVNADGTSAGSSFQGVGNGANIVLQAQNDLTVANTFNLANETGNNNVSLTLQAGNNININAAVTASGTGTLSLSANDNGGGTATGTGAVNIGAAGGLTTANHDISITAHDFNLTAGGTINSGSGNVTIKPTADVTSINVGANNGGDFVIDDTEIGAITTSGTLTIGDSTLNIALLAQGVTANSFNALNNLTLDTGGNITANQVTTGRGNISMNAGGTITVASSGINATGAVNTAGGNVNLNATGTLAVNAAIVSQGGAATAAGAAGGNVSLSGGTVTTGAGGSINTSGSAATAGFGGAGGVIIVDSTGTISTRSLTADGGTGAGFAGGNAGAINLSAGNGITLNNNLAAKGGTGTSAGSDAPITLSTTAGGVSQAAGALNSGGLLLLGAGTFNVGGNLNSVGTVAANVNGSLTYQDANALTVGTVAGTVGGAPANASGIVSTSHAISVSTVNAALSVNQSVDAGTSTATLTAGSIGNDNLLTVGAGVTVHGAAGVNLVADNLTINPAAAINAGAATASLHEFENGTLINVGGPNGVATLGLTAAELNTITAGTLKIGDANSGVLSVTAPVAPVAAATLSLQSGASIGQNAGAIITDTALTLQSGTTITLPEANQVGVLKVAGTGGPVQFADAQNLDVQGISAAGQTVTLTPVGPRTLGESSGTISAAELDLNNWGATTLNQANQVGILKVTGATGAVQFTDAANLDAQGINAPGQTVALSGNGGQTLGQSTGIINAGELDLNNWAAATLNQINQVGVLKVTGAVGPLQFTDAANLDIQGIGAAGQVVTLNPSGSHTLGESSGTIVAGELDLNNWGATTLNQANQVGVLKVTGATGALQFTSAANLDVQGIADPGQVVTLTGVGGHTVGESAGTINAAELDLNTLGGTTLNQANQVGVLKVTGAVGPTQFTDAVNLDAQGISALGQTVTLSASGSHTLGQSTGIISAGELDLNNWAATVLNQLNQVSALKVTGATGALQFTDAASLDVHGIGAAGQVVTLTPNGSLTLGESSGTINAAELDLNNWGATTLNQANQVGVLKVTGATGAFQYTSGANLDVQGIADPGQTVSLSSTGAFTLGQSAGNITSTELDLNNWAAGTLNQINQANVLKVTGAVGALQFTDAANLDVQGIGAAGQTVTLSASGSHTLGESTGTVNAGQLTLNNWSTTTLNQANQVGVLKATGATGAFQYTGAANLDVQGIADPGQLVTLTGSGGHTLGESAGTISAAELDLNNWGATTLNQANQAGILKVTGAAGAVQFTDAGNLDVEGIAAGGQAVTIAATGDNSLLTVGGAANVSGSSVTLAGDRINLAGTVTTPGVAWFHESTAGRQITVGTDDTSAPTASGGTLGLTTVEMNNVTAGTLRIGDANSGNLVVTVPLVPAFGTLSLQSGAALGQAAGATITVNNLAVQAAAAITLDGANQVGTLAANGGGGVQFNNAGALAVGSADGVNGVSANNSAITITTGNGALTVNNTPAAADVNAGSGMVNLTAGSANNVLTIGAGAGVVGTGGVTFTADDMTISGTVNSGAANTIFQPFSAGHVVNLGPTVVAGDLNLTQAELNEVTANVLQVGNSVSGPPIGASLVTAPATVHQLLILGGNSSITLLSQQLAALSAVEVPMPKLDVAQFSSASLSLDEASKILPAGAIGTIWLQLPFPQEKQRTYKVEEVSKWTSGRVAAVGTTTGPQMPR